MNTRDRILELLKLEKTARPVVVDGETVCYARHLTLGDLISVNRLACQGVPEIVGYLIVSCVDEEGMYCFSEEDAETLVNCSGKKATAIIREVMLMNHPDPTSLEGAFGKGEEPKLN